MAKMENTFSWGKTEKASGGNVDLSNYYTKGEVDNKFNDYYSKNEVNNKFNNYYSKSELDNRFNDYFTKDQTIRNFYQKGEIDDLINKNNKNYYTKAEIDALLKGDRPPQPLPEEFNIGETEIAIPNYKVNGKQVYAKYVSGLFRGNQWVQLAEKVDTFLFNGVSIFSTAKWDQYNVNGGTNGGGWSSDYYAYYVKVYQDMSNHIYAYMKGTFQERLTYRGVIYYTKI